MRASPHVYLQTSRPVRDTIPRHLPVQAVAANADTSSVNSLTSKLRRSSSVIPRILCMFKNFLLYPLRHLEVDIKVQQCAASAPQWAALRRRIRSCQTAWVGTITSYSLWQAVKETCEIRRESKRLPMGGLPAHEIAPIKAGGLQSRFSAPPLLARSPWSVAPADMRPPRSLDSSMKLKSEMDEFDRPNSP